MAYGGWVPRSGWVASCIACNAKCFVSAGHVGCPWRLPNTSTSTISAIEVIQTGARRRWTSEEKLRIVAESYSGRRMVKPTARRYGLSTGQLYMWRSMALQGKFSNEPHEPGFAPAMIVPDGASVAQTASRCSADASLSDGRTIIVLAGGRRIIVDRHVDAGALRRVVEALERP